MGEPVTGAWARKYQLQIPYVDARKWGTGINSVHSLYGGPGRPIHPKLDTNQLDGRTPTNFAVSQDFIEGPEWGYQHEDIAGLDVFADPNVAVHGYGDVRNTEAWPEWEYAGITDAGGIGDPPTGGAPGPVNPQTGRNRAIIPGWTSRPWQFVNKNRLRSIRGGEAEQDTPGPRGTSSEIPMETVNEGWINKGSSGGIDPGEVPDDNVMPSDTAQYERQTSMQQRHKTLNNERAMARGADGARSDIPSRIAPMKIKHYSEGERHYDMFPYQIDDIPRPFTYRTAGTGPQRYLETNEQWLRTPLQRTPPPDPSMGVPESELSDIAQYGYSNEDQGYY